MLNLSNSILLQKCIESGYLPISSFLTGYQSDNDNIGTIPYRGEKSRITDSNLSSMVYSKPSNETNYYTSRA